MLCSAATLPLSHYRGLSAACFTVGADLGKTGLTGCWKAASAVNLCSGSSTINSLIKSFAVMYIRGVASALHASHRDQRHLRLTFLADILPVPFVELDLAPHGLLGDLVRVVRSERLVSAEQDVRDHPVDPHRSAIVPTVSTSNALMIRLTRDSTCRKVSHEVSQRSLPVRRTQSFLQRYPGNHHHRSSVSPCQTIRCLVPYVSYRHARETGQADKSRQNTHTPKSAMTIEL